MGRNLFIWELRTRTSTKWSFSNLYAEFRIGAWTIAKQLILSAIVLVRTPPAHSNKRNDGILPLTLFDDTKKFPPHVSDAGWKPRWRVMARKSNLSPGCEKTISRLSSQKNKLPHNKHTSKMLLPSINSVAAYRFVGILTGIVIICICFEYLARCSVSVKFIPHLRSSPSRARSIAFDVSNDLLVRLLEKKMGEIAC